MFPSKYIQVSGLGGRSKYIKDKELKNLIGNAIATIYIPIDEDFGMSPVESMAAGKPVIGSGEGGLLETVVHDQTGWLLSPNPSAEELIQILKNEGIKNIKDAVGKAI